MRYFAELAYNGRNYYGWQKQPDDASVQATLENALSTILNTPLEVVGCGRTDAGVHAGQYYIHFDYGGAFPEAFLRRLNKFLPADIAVYRIFRVRGDAHARYDALLRSYAYYTDLEKNPFRTHTAYHYPYPEPPSFDALQQTAELLGRYETFFPFCKSNTDVKTMRCAIKRCEWEQPNPRRLIFHVSADRFLRGMVRLMVGACLNVGMGKLELDAVQSAMDRQERLEKSWSVPPQGLFLTRVVYDFKAIGLRN